MDLKKRKKEHKKMSFNRFLVSFKYTYEGLKYAYLNEQSMRLHAIGSFIIFILGLIIGLNMIEWFLILIVATISVIAELLNTGIEATVDLITKDIHPLAKIAKDCGSAAGGIAGIVYALISTIIIISHLIG
ncbi:MAG: diacylglycerol kinase [Firmicutes bacterium]|nr:diacylglycerol kinase [Bacillota bacterium]